MATPTKEKQKEPVDIVHQNAIRVETILKEQQCQKLYTEFTINPFKKLHVLPDKPMGRKMHEEVDEDPAFLKLIHGAYSEPTKKYTRPMTESQEIGWISTPLITSDRTDRRLNFPRQNSEITKYMDAAWRLKEQTQNLR
ncbi:protein FAM183A [Neoarius graeffei]|uniref:protein FAM183A n=1 Tax=Neoarius graeffei TaxID=443677 RepID=UPI00298CCC6F|nr:protein FAM183A [Neoarius graeffei]